MLVLYQDADFEAVGTMVSKWIPPFAGLIGWVLDFMMDEAMDGERWTTRRKNIPQEKIGPTTISTQNH